MRYLILLFFMLFFSCKDQQKNTADASSISQETSVSQETSRTDNWNTPVPEAGITEVTLPNGTVITKNDLSANGYSCRIDSINIYDDAMIESPYKQIANTEVILFKLEHTDDWLYVVSSDFSRTGYIKTRDLSEYSFYGDWNANSNSSGYYQRLLNREYAAVMAHPGIKRYGPAVVILADNKTRTFWDTFYGYGRNIKHLVIDRYPTNHFLIYQQSYEGGLYYIYSVHEEEPLAQCSNQPIFNNSFTNFVSFGSGSAESAVLELFSAADTKYKKEKEVNVYSVLGIAADARPPYTLVWIHDKEFSIEYEDIGAYILYFDQGQWKERIVKQDLTK